MSRFSRSRRSPSAPWATYALLALGRMEPSPGSPRSIDEVRALRDMDRVETRQVDDNGMKVFQFRMKDSV